MLIYSISWKTGLCFCLILTVWWRRKMQSTVWSPASKYAKNNQFHLRWPTLFYWVYTLKMWLNYLIWQKIVKWPPLLFIFSNTHTKQLYNRQFNIGLFLSSWYYILFYYNTIYSTLVFLPIPIKMCLFRLYLLSIDA